MRAHGTRACFVHGPNPGTGNGCRCEPCEDIPPPPPQRREVEEQVTKVDREALRVMPDDRVAEVHADGFAAARRALAEAEWRKTHKQEAAK